MNIDRCAEFILDVLAQNGYRAYVVGGCVRDTLLNKVPKDWDICTNAFPNTVHDIFESLGIYVVDSGIKYGTVSVIMSPADIALINQTDEKFSMTEMISRIYEITTFRKHSGGRKEAIVEFGDSIETDLKRRDFTMNALAYNSRDGIIDVCGGVSDINNRVIRCVGDAKSRLSEDWLRILRAIRFQSELGFDIESNTHYCVNELANLVARSSGERIQSELNKIVVADYARVALLNNKEAIGKIIPELRSTIGFNQNNPNHKYDVYEHCVEALNVIVTEGNKDYRLGIATLLHDIGKPLTYSEDENKVGHFYKHAEVGSLITSNILKRLHYSNYDIQVIENLIKYHDRDIPNKASVKRLLNRIDMDTLKSLIRLKHADTLSHEKNDLFEHNIAQLTNITNWIDEIQEQDESFKVSDLEISGKDLIKLGYTPGRQFKIILDDVLNLVIDGDISNTKNVLVNYVMSHYDKDTI